MGGEVVGEREVIKKIHLSPPPLPLPPSLTLVSNNNEHASGGQSRMQPLNVAPALLIWGKGELIGGVDRF